MGRKTRLSRVQAAPSATAINPDVAADLRLAAALHVRGDIAQAQTLYQQVLSHAPQNFDGLHMSGVLALQGGHLHEGIGLIDTGRRIRLAYVSADFRDHVVARFMASLYERQDRAQFEVIGVSLAAGDGSAVVARSKRALNQFIDVSRMSDQQAAARLRDLELDVATDLTG